MEPREDESVSEDSEMEWNDDIEEPCVCFDWPPLFNNSMVLTVRGRPPSGLGRGGYKNV